MSLTSDQSWGDVKGGFVSHSTGAVVLSVSTTCSPNDNLLSRPDSAVPEDADAFREMKMITPSRLQGNSRQLLAKAKICSEMLTAAVMNSGTDGKRCDLAARDVFLTATPEALVSHSGVIINPEVEGNANGNEDELSEVGGRLDIDDVEDLEELLLDHSFNLDYEGKSTGSIPSELISLVGPPPPLAAPESAPCAPGPRRNKRGCEELEDGVESKFIKKPKSFTIDEDDLIKSRNCCSSPDTSFIIGTAPATASIEGGELSQHCHPLSDDGRQQHQQNGEDFSWDDTTDELQMLCNDCGFEMPEQQCSSCSKEGGGDSVSSGSARQSRRQKIKATVKMLREAIPGGDGMDISIVLDEAIQYVKLLQLQVQTLGAKRLAERASTG